MSRPHLFIYCAGAFGKEVFDIADRQNQRDGRWADIWFIDDFVVSGKAFYRTTAFSLNMAIQHFGLDSMEAVVAIGEPLHRETLYCKLSAHNIRLTQVLDPTVVVSPTAHLGNGVILAPFCSVAASAKIGNNVAVNVQTIIGHDIGVGAHSVISSMVNLGGACIVGEGSYVGMGSQVKNELKIGNRVIVGMGSVVYHDIGDDLIAMGNPARVLRRNEERRVFKKI